MNRVRLIMMVAFWFVAGAAAASEEVIRDGGVGMTRAELEYIVRHWTPEMQAAAARDVGDRLELLNMALANKKIALEADKLTPEQDGDVYWRKEMMVRAMLRKLMVELELRDAEMPDMTALAKERYLTQKNKFALLPEQRLSSHILFKCSAKEECDRDAVQQRAAAVLAELEAGASFEELAREHSEDLRTGAQGGRYDRWLSRGNREVAPEYIEEVFKLEKEGDRTGVVPSRFGYHIIRLDEIKPQHYRSYEESEADILAVLRKEYQELNAKAFDARFRISDQAYIDGRAMEEIFAPYQPTPQAAVPQPSGARPPTDGGQPGR